MKEFHSEAGNRFSENGLDLGKNGLWKDIGSLDLTDTDNEFEIIKNSINDILKNGDHCISLGGDHSITYPIIAGYHEFYQTFRIFPSTGKSAGIKLYKGYPESGCSCPNRLAP